MSSTNAAVTFEAPMDPSDVMDYVASFVNLLEDGETLLTFSIDISTNAENVGVEIKDIPAAAVSLDGKSITFWTQVSDAQQDNIAFCDEGFKAELVFTITTTASPREYQRTFIIVIKQL